MIRFRRLISDNALFIHFFAIVTFLLVVFSCSSKKEEQSVHSLYKQAKQNATACFNEQKECDKAIALFDKIVKLDSTHHLAYYNRGVCKMTLKNFKGALADFSTAIKHYSDDADYFYNKGYVELELGMRSEACTDFNISFNKGASDAKAIIDQICQ